jgi:hypothetical protein
VPRPTLVGLTCIGALCAACTGEQPSPTMSPPVADSTHVASARAAADALGPDLMGMLMQQLQASGPEAAFAVCADSAQLRTARHSAAGVQVRRVGTRVRNPANAPDSLEQRVLEYLATELAGARLPQEHMEVAATGADHAWELRYFRPIVVAERCLTCHGDRATIPAPVQRVIAERYPTDAAVGYAAGELRGAIAVRVALPPGASR